MKHLQINDSLRADYRMFASNRVYSGQTGNLLRYLWRFFVIGTLVGFGVVLHAKPPIPAQGEVDAYTLLLASFEEDPQQADYAHGWDLFAGSGAQLTEGYYGKGLNLRELQHRPENYTESPALTPFLNYWGFWPRGNIEYDEGTIEFWFQVGESKAVRNHPGQRLFFFHYYQPLTAIEREDGGVQPVQPFVLLTSTRLSWRLVTLSGGISEGSVALNRIPGFEGLDPADWHHFAVTWADGELVFYLDGRILATDNLEGQGGIAWVAASHRDIAMNGIVLDELRISSIVRYRDAFEPQWRDGKRPARAFPGNPEMRRYPARYRSPLQPTSLPLAVGSRSLDWTTAGRRLSFDSTTGVLREPWQGGTVTSGGLLLWRGYERTALQPQSISNWSQEDGQLSFEQIWPSGLTVRHELQRQPDSEQALSWQMTFDNHGSEHLLLEALLAMAVPWRDTVEWFDGSWQQTELGLPRRRDDFVGTLPAVAAASADRQWFLLGLDPRQLLSSLISEWIPAEGTGGQLRQGTRVVLAPGEQQQLKFIVARGNGVHGALEGVDFYHQLAPELYRQDPSIPIHSYLPVAHYFEHIYTPDLARQTYAANQWGHGPGHTKGDEWGSEEWWDNPGLKGRFDYQHAERMQRAWRSIDNMRQQALWRSKYSYDYTYTLRRYHYVPNLTPMFIVEDLWPDYQPEDDPLVAGQYYRTINGNWIVNEYRNPLGEHFIDQSLQLIHHIGRYSPGFINDMSQTAPYRHNDASVAGVAGRSFAPHRGEYIVAAFGHVDRYQAIGDQVINGHRMSVWSDGGVASYLLGAHSPANVIEGGAHLSYFTGPGQMYIPGRILLGEKPLAVHSPEGGDWTGRFFPPEAFTPESLREYYRYNFRQILLFALDHGIYLDPINIQGKQWLFEHNPILVESISSGRRILNAAEVKAPLWVRRGGGGPTSLLAIGNHSAQTVVSPVLIHDSYFGHGRPVFGPYFGGNLTSIALDEERSQINSVAVDGRGVEALRLLGWAHGAVTEVEVDWSGDGLTITVDVQVTGEGLLLFEPQVFEPIYQLTSAVRNGAAVEPDAGGRFELQSGDDLQLQYQTPWLAFSSEQWEALDLVDADGRTNFVLVGDMEPGFDQGTALFINQFLAQYDEENGIIGTTREAVLVGNRAHLPEGYDGWVLVFNPQQSDLAHGRVRIDSDDSTVYFEAPSSGELRRTMVLFMRLLDRKYPRVGRFMPLRKRSLVGFSNGIPGINPGREAPPWEVWFRSSSSQTADFFAGFEDPHFLSKPLLDAEYEDLYEGGNLDFRDQYLLRHAPYLFEPTFEDRYVYGPVFGAP